MTNIVQTGAGNFDLPRDMVEPLWSPGWPIAPIARPEDNELPRTIDYPVGINFTLQPRIGYDGLFPVQALKASYQNVAEVAAPVNLIIRELCAFTPTLRNKKTKQIVTDHPYSWMTRYPDGKTPFSVWLSRFKKSALVYAAPAFYMRQEGKNITAMEYIDGSTLFLIVNSRGNLPEPNETDPQITNTKQYWEKVRRWNAQVNGGRNMPITTPAFTQIIKGVPFSFWNKDQVYFVPEPPSPSVDTPYGESYIERAWAWIQLIAVMTAFELAHYKTGNMPEGLMSVPKDWFPSMAKLGIGEKEWNMRMADSSQLQHARIRWVPEGTIFTQTKKADFPEQLYRQANNNIMAAIGIPNTEMGERPGVGLGGKGFEEGAAHNVTRQLLEAQKIGLENPFNHTLKVGEVDDVEFVMAYPQQEIDPNKQQEDMWQKFIHGVNTLNDCLSQQGKETIGDPKDKDNIANMHMFVTGNSVFVIEKMSLDPMGVAQPVNAKPGQMGGSPVNPEDVTGKEHTPEDMKTAKKLAEMIEQSFGKKADGKFISVPNALQDFDPAEVEMGMKEEQEHAHTVNYDENAIRHIVLDHLKEDAHYYTHLKEAGMMEKRYKVIQRDGDWIVWNETKNQMVSGGNHGKDKTKAEAHARALYANVPDAEKMLGYDLDLMKHCGVDPQDAEYFGQPIAREMKIPFPKNHHANGVEIVAITPKDLPSIPALFKPEGEEKMSLNQHIGGPQFIREEVAWQIDQSLGFHLVPLSYITETKDGERGAVIWYTFGDTDPKEASEYGMQWIEKAAVLDYIMAQQDRPPALKNRLTHPDDPNRVILIDNGFSMPVDENKTCRSVFYDLMKGKPLCDETARAVFDCMNDVSLWTDVQDMVGEKAAKNALERTKLLAKNKSF